MAVVTTTVVYKGKFFQKGEQDLEPDVEENFRQRGLLTEEAKPVEAKTVKKTPETPPPSGTPPPSTPGTPPPSTPGTPPPAP